MEMTTNLRHRQGEKAEQGEGWSVPKAIYAVLMGALLVPGYFYVICTYTEPTFGGAPYQFPIVFWILRCITAFMALAIGKLWKDRGFQIMAAFLVLKFLRIYFETPSSVFDETVSESLLFGFWTFTACYGLGGILGLKQIRRFLQVCASCWTAGAVVYAAIGIYAAWTDLRIETPAGQAYWTLAEGGRLFLVYYVTVSGSVLSISVMIALCGALLSKHAITRVLFGIAGVTMLLALCLCDSRTAQVTVSAGIGTVAGILILRLFGKRKKRPWYAWAAATGAAAVLFIGLILGLVKTITVFSELKLRGGLLISNALADESGAQAISNRGYTGGEAMLALRPHIWRAAIYYITQNPKVLLFGTSILNSMNGVNATPPLYFWAAHCHSMPLMILLENGIPGVVLVGYFLLSIGVRSARIVRAKSSPLWLALLPAVILSVLAGELVECFTWLQCGYSPVMPFLFTAMGIVSAAGKKDSGIIKRKEEDQP